MDAYAADAQLATNPRIAEAAYKAAIEAEGEAMPLGYEGLAALAERPKRIRARRLEDAMRAGSTSAPVYVAAAEGKTQKRSRTSFEEGDSAESALGGSVVRAGGIGRRPFGKRRCSRKPSSWIRALRYWVELAHLQTSDGHALAAQGSWLKAEDSAPTDIERKRYTRNGSAANKGDWMRQTENGAESAMRCTWRSSGPRMPRRLVFERPKTRPTSNWVQERTKPNRRTVVPWEDTIPKRKVEGRLTAVECLRSAVRLTVKDRAGRTVSLLLAKSDAASLACGVQQPVRQVSISYAAEPDDNYHTEGRVLTMLVR